MVKLIIEPKKAKDGQIDYIVTYHDVKTDNSVHGHDHKRPE